MTIGMKTAIEVTITTVEAMPRRQGKAELLIHLKGGRNLSFKEAVQAKCYDCMGGYDEPEDCMITTCSLHPFMPYRQGGARKVRTLSEEQRKATGERLRKARIK